MPPAAENDQASNIQRQTMVIFPLISIAYGGFLPAGLFLYWIVTTIFSIVQQYLIVGWGSLFPAFGWTPGFAKDHKPRFPVAMPTPITAQGRDARRAAHHAYRSGRICGFDCPPKRAGPPGPTRETTLT